MTQVTGYVPNSWIEDMEVKIENNTFQAIDHSDYLDEDDHFVIHTLCYVKDADDITIINQTSFCTGSAATEKKIEDPYEVTNINDGYHQYWKVVMPTSAHAPSGENDRLYYNTTDEKVYIKSSDDGTFTAVDFTNKDGFDVMWDFIWLNSLNNCFCYTQDVFCIYKLIKCYILKERNNLNLYLRNNCKKPCITDNSYTADTDLLLSAIIVISHLIDNQDFVDALVLFNGVSSCENLCSGLTKNIGDCGCGGTTQ